MIQDPPTTLLNQVFLRPLLFLIYIAVLPETNATIIASFADDVAVLSVYENPQITFDNLQVHLNLRCEWYKKW